MVPVIAGSGRSFEGAFLYYFHDKKASTTARVAWSENLNMMTECAAKAWKVMAYTAKHQEYLKRISGQRMTGAKLEKPVFAYSLSWHPEQQPDKRTMMEAAHQSLAKLGLSEHEAMIAAHKDEPQPHIHIIVNKVHPLTGLVAKLKYTKRRLSDFALQWEKREGKIYCGQRADNKKKREQGQHTKYGDPHIINAWKQSNNGQSFIHALKQSGYHLAQGRKRLVIVDPYGKTHNPVRHLEGIKTKEFKAKLADIDLSMLPSADEVAHNIEDINKSQYRQQIHDEERGAQFINDLQSRHIEQRSKVFNTHTKNIRKEKQQLQDYYEFATKKAQLIALRKRCQNPGFFRKLFGQAKADREEFRVLKLNYMSAKQRYDERINALKNKRDQDMKQLQARQEKEKQALQNRLKQRRPLSNAQSITKTVNNLKSMMTQAAYTHLGGPGLGM